MNSPFEISSSARAYVCMRISRDLHWENNEQAKEV